eukprot:COSAG06_NODE_75590_length_129_cov_127.933333_1_plen_43_part_11
MLGLVACGEVRVTCASACADESAASDTDGHCAMVGLVACGEVA